MQLRYTRLFILLGIAFFIKLFSGFPEAVEKYYSNGVYPIISRVLRWLFGWIPFSFGDILYAFAAFLLLFGCWKLINAIKEKRISREWLLRVGVKVMTGWLWVYILFNSFWGLNYNRLGIAHQSGYFVSKYTNNELETLVLALISRVNELRAASLPEREPLHHKRTLFTNSFKAYQVPSSDAPYLRYGGQSVKPSIYSYLGNYLGFTGYYNPFTGEAQVNTTVPEFVQPFTTCHEIGHQLGYAKENEANLAGFLTAKNSASPVFRYSAYFDLYLYAIRDLALRDSVKAKELHEGLSPEVKADIKTLRDFNQRHVGFMEPLIRSLYSQFLRINQQPSGMESYNQVVALVIGYMRKYGVSRL